MNSKTGCNRRGFLGSLAVIGSTALVARLTPTALAAASQPEPEVSAVEDLMREHGALHRILLIYEEAIRRIRAQVVIEPDLVKQAATLVRNFIESYHEKLEEEYVFPKLSQAGKLTGTVATLLAQHRAGRKLTAGIIARCSAPHFHRPAELRALATELSEFVTMYRPHAAREDTVVFPEFKKVVPAKEYDRLGDRFEEREHAQLGDNGFEGVLTQIAGIETKLNIHDLARFTPKA
ncbi:hemerythrin domain-containing protein [Geomesophilobacter sediminis]|uniref:Hemerythrin domain-containing protein n=1 Tax=Geomesophilobacter sediminis TaxID=2798584 RepID=A0A8J7LVI2_9BACT|nr:hemerythrin domain-containing protein [Geomesophilobacter sediminis]MBJ6725549.1 hemerythrin domain-containing protein [Geomesophilobacter sediminis]